MDLSSQRINSANSQPGTGPHDTGTCGLGTQFPARIDPPSKMAMLNLLPIPRSDL